LNRTRSACALAVALLAGGCEDIRRFSGTWAGPISADPVHQLGYGPDAVLRAEIGAVTRTQLEGTVDLPGPAGPVPFEPIRGAAQDALGELRIEGEPLRTYLGYLRPAGEAPYLCVVSLFSEDRIDVRAIRGPDEIYGVFSLRRVRTVGDGGLR
jgi:hypothetical protein